MDVEEKKELDEINEVIVNFYKRYSHAIKAYRIKNFVADLNKESPNFSEYKKVAEALSQDDIRWIPVIACAYADDLLKRTFSAVLPTDVPGGINNMLSIYGPLSDFSKRLNLAYAFDVFSPHLLRDIDTIRRVRNTISHSWSLEEVNAAIINCIPQLTAIEDIFSEDEDGRLTLESLIQSDPFKVFRFRIILLLGLMFYEAPIYYEAKKIGLNPHKALYEGNQPDRLGIVSKISHQACCEGGCWPFKEFNVKKKG